MSTGLRILLTVTALAAFALAAFMLRPSQPFPSFLRRFKPGGRDPLYRLLYSPGGYPRAFAWAVPVIAACVSAAGIWFAVP